MSNKDKVVFFWEYQKPGNVDALELMRLKDGFVIRTYLGNDKGPEIISTRQELIALRDMLNVHIEDTKGM